MAKVKQINKKKNPNTFTDFIDWAKTVFLSYDQIPFQEEPHEC